MLIVGHERGRHREEKDQVRVPCSPGQRQMDMVLSLREIGNIVRKVHFRIKLERYFYILGFVKTQEIGGSVLITRYCDGDTHVGD